MMYLGYTPIYGEDEPTHVARTTIEILHLPAAKAEAFARHEQYKFVGTSQSYHIADKRTACVQDSVVKAEQSTGDGDLDLDTGLQADAGL